MYTCIYYVFVSISISVCVMCKCKTYIHILLIVNLSITSSNNNCKFLGKHCIQIDGAKTARDYLDLISYLHNCAIKEDMTLADH